MLAILRTAQSKDAASRAYQPRYSRQHDSARCSSSSDHSLGPCIQS